MKNEMIKVGVIVGWSAALFVGCSSIPSVGPNYHEKEIKVPQMALPDAGKPTTNLTTSCEYIKAEGKTDDRVEISKNVITQWWKRFDDPILVEIVDNAVSNNVSYKMAQKRLEQANWQLLGSYAAYLPKFSIDGGWTRFWNGKNTRSGGGQYNQYNLQQAGLDGNWELDIFGGSRRLTEAALAQAEAEGWTVADAWVSLTTQIGKQYVNLRTTQERIEVARTNLALQTETYDILKSRLDSGIGDELAVNQCAYIVEQTRARIPTLLANEEAIKNAIAVLTGEIPGALHEKLKAQPSAKKLLLSPQKVSELPLDLIRARPDVKNAERNLAAQTARIGAAIADWFPKLYITGQVGWETKKNARLFSKDSFLAALGPAVSWPIFQGGAIYANVKMHQAKTEELALNYELAIEKAYGEVRDAYAAYSQEYHRYQALAGAVKAATDAVTISKDLYKNGLKDFNNVLDAQRSRLEFEEQYVLSRGMITGYLITLYEALGGGLKVDEPRDLDME